MNSISKALRNSLVLSAAAIVSMAAFSSISHATPGDSVCVGQMPNGGAKIEVVLGYDNFEQTTASFISVLINDKNVVSFPKGTISAAYVDVGTPKLPMINFEQSAKDGDATLKLRYPEQDPDAESLTIYLTMDLPAQKFTPAYVANEVKLNCEY